MAVKRTPEQEAVVKNRGGGLLVSAAAGSGKTRVLVERLLDRILTEGKNVDEFLIITFTRAAAEELRGRIAKEISEALALQPENAHLRRQTALLYKAQISTIHSFCTVLLRQWGHLLDLPADFALCEDEEAQVLMARTLDQVLEERYENVDPEGDFAKLLDVLTAGRDDSRLVDITLDVYGKTQSYPDPTAWLEDQRAALDLTGSPTWVRPPGADSCWRMPARPWTTGQGRWNGPVIWPRETPFWKRPTCPVSPPPSRTWKTWPRPSPAAGMRPPSSLWTIPGLAGPRMWRT